MNQMFLKKYIWILCVFAMSSLYGGLLPTTTSGVVYYTQPVVVATDEHGNIDTAYVGSITLSKATGTGTLGGTVTKTAVSGKATYTDIKYSSLVDKETYTLGASDNSINGTSDNILSDVIATKLIFTTQPAPISIERGVETTFTTVPVVKAVDADDAVDIDFIESVSLNSVDGVFTNDTVTASNGIATFTGLTLNSSSLLNSITLTANDEDAVGSNLPTVDSNAIAVTTNQAPTSTNASFTLTTNTTKIFTSTDFSFVDVDVGDALSAIYITALVNKGTLSLNGSNIVLNQEILSANIGDLQFSPVTNDDGTPYTTFGFTVSDGEDNSTLAYTVTINVNALDTDGDGIPDVIDTDDDGDGVLDVNDAFPLDRTEWLDTDGDGVGNNADTDDDNDGISDEDELFWGFDTLNDVDANQDFDSDGVSNKDEIKAGSDPLDPNDTKIPKKYAPIMVGDILIFVPYK